MDRIVPKFKNILKANWQTTFTYPGMLFIWMIDVFFVPFVMLLIWHRVSLDTPSIAQDFPVIINYYLLIPLSSMLTGAWHGVFFANQIRTGRLSAHLIKPLPVIIYDVTNNLAEKSTKISFLLPLILLGSLFFPLTLSTNSQIIILTLLGLILSITIAFLIQTCIGFIGFWLEDVSALLNLLDISDYTIGGRFIPFFLLPPAIQPITKYLPFRYVHAFPAEIISQSINTAEVVSGLAIQLVWIILLTFTAFVLWRQGIKRYTAVGG